MQRLPWDTYLRWTSQYEPSMRKTHLTHQKYHGIAYTYLLLIFPNLRCLPGRKHAGDMFCMFSSHLLYTLKGDNMFVDDMSKNTPLTLGYPSWTPHRDELDIIDACEGGEATHPKILASYHWYWCWEIDGKVRESNSHSPLRSCGVDLASVCWNRQVTGK